MSKYTIRHITLVLGLIWGQISLKSRVDKSNTPLNNYKGVEHMETIRIYNLKQVAGYMYAGVNPISVEKDGSTGKIVFVFKKEDTLEVWEKWKAGTLC